MFKAIGKAGTAAKALTSTFTTTNRLLGMPGQVATSGLDALTSRIVGPISGAISVAIGQLTITMNQILGPALTAIGNGISNIARQNPIGAGVGGLVGATAGGVLGSLTGIPGLGTLGAIGGGLLGGAIEAGITPGHPLENRPIPFAPPIDLPPLEVPQAPSTPPLTPPPPPPLTATRVSQLANIQNLDLQKKQLQAMSKQLKIVKKLFMLEKRVFK